MVGLGEHGFHQRQRGAHPDQRIRAASRGERDAGGGVMGDQADPVTGTGGHRAEQQGGVHRVVEARGVADAARAGPPGVEEADDPAIPFRPKRLDRDGAAPRAAPPVDHPYVVAWNVVAQAVEFRALPAPAQRGVTFDLPQAGQGGGQVAAGGERRQHPQPPGRGMPSLSASQTEGAQRADGYPVGVTITPPGGPQHQVAESSLPRWNGHPPDTWRGT